MSPTYLVFGAAAVNLPVQQVGHLLVRRVGHGGLDPSPTAVAGDPRGAHHPGHPLVVDPFRIGDAVAELGGDPRRTVGAVLGVHPSGYAPAPASHA